MLYKGTEYKMVFNLDAVCELEDKGIKLQELLSGEMDVRKVVTISVALLNAPLDEPVFTEKMLKKELTPVALKGLSDEIRGALIDGMKMETKTDKPRDIYLEEIEAKKTEA